MRRTPDCIWRYAVACVLAVLLSACGEQHEVEQAAMQMTGGHPGRGRAKMTVYGCDTCHAIPGVRGADALVGPPLAGIASRMYIAGVLENTPYNMIRWLQNPPAIDSLTAMPNLGVSELDARDIASYLYTLRE